MIGGSKSVARLSSPFSTAARYWRVNFRTRNPATGQPFFLMAGSAVRYYMSATLVRFRSLPGGSDLSFNNGITFSGVVFFGSSSTLNVDNNDFAVSYQDDNSLFYFQIQFFSDVIVRQVAIKPRQDSFGVNENPFELVSVQTSSTGSFFVTQFGLDISADTPDHPSIRTWSW